MCTCMCKEVYISEHGKIPSLRSEPGMCVNIYMHMYMYIYIFAYMCVHVFTYVE